MNDRETFGDWLFVRVVWLAALAFSFTFWFNLFPAFLRWLHGAIR